MLLRSPSPTRALELRPFTRQRYPGLGPRNGEPIKPHRRINAFLQTKSQSPKYYRASNGSVMLRAADWTGSLILWLQDNMFVSGSFQSIGGKPGSKLARWDGKEWYPLVRQGTIGYLGMVAASDTELAITPESSPDLGFPHPGAQTVMARLG